ncbi:hypothetical protein FVEG_17468 [Fusarium verticillioides 7600]|uniref:Heterokaryon incompatibility domain-containing protein n=1 Tax=Gibberella moniliformis (strain M3125 / FGSC 7600) TaxID=334819 RepID=W7NFX9_GIBM7|nr:hypothetical protein FVEG_17468 [Fusarium verticillioides 7600]EWG55182.1 hypothetical protein FVEG_17468 [Fusarium verticillioides 7600]
MGTSLRLQPPLSHMNEETLSWMQSKVESCILHNHLNPDKTFIPDRLINVRENQLSLVLTKDFQFRDPESHRYIALTYCWGPEPHASKQLKTTRVNIHQHQQRIPELSLPQVIKDAVTVTRALSTPFLWVDALCILQDDTSDWDKQCAVMERIYGNAYVTVAAVSSHNCEEGFIERTDRILLPVRKKSGDTYVFGIYSPLYQANAFEEIRYSPWLARGWTFQERIASNRILMFSNKNVHFKCKYFTQSMGFHRTRFEDRQYIMLDRVTIDSGSTAAIYQEWSKTVAQIVPRFHNLTRKTDFLPSIAGIASLFSKRLNDDYAAGLWKNSMHQSLCWAVRVRVVDYEEMLKRLKSPFPYIAPSWSWACQSDYFSFDIYLSELSADCRPEFHNLEIDIVLRGESVFGKVRNAALNLTSKVYVGSPRLTLHRETPPLFENDGIVRFDGRYFADIESDCYLRDIFESIEGRALAAPISFLLIGSTIRRERRARNFLWRQSDNYGSLSASTVSAEGGGNLEEGTISKRLAYGLLIHPTGNPNEYHRVGTFLSSPEYGGGLSVFDDIEVRTVRLV